MNEVAVGVWLAGLAAWLWTGVCIDRTRDQRRAIIVQLLYRSGDYTDNVRVLERVPFGRHLRYVITFRDWRRLYPAALARRASLALYGVA